MITFRLPSSDVRRECQNDGENNNNNNNNNEKDEGTSKKEKTSTN